MGIRRWIRRFGLGFFIVSLTITLGLGAALGGIIGLLALPMAEETPIQVPPQAVDTITSLLLPLAGALAVVVPLTVVLFVGVGWSYARHLELSAKLYVLLAGLERSSGVVAQFHPTTLLHGRLTPQERQTRRIEGVKNRYVAGELSMAEFERELERTYDETVPEHENSGVAERTRQYYWRDLRER